MMETVVLLLAITLFCAVVVEDTSAVYTYGRRNAVYTRNGRRVGDNDEQLEDNAAELDSNVDDLRLIYNDPELCSKACSDALLANCSISRRRLACSNNVVAEIKRQCHDSCQIYKPKLNRKQQFYADEPWWYESDELSPWPKPHYLIPLPLYRK